MFSAGFTSPIVMLLFPLLITFTLLCTVCDSVLSNIDEVLSINPSANVFVFGNFNVHHKDWLNYSGGTDRPGELCYNFYIPNNVTLIINFSNWIPGCDSHSPAFLDLFLLHWVILIMLLSQFPLIFQ